MTVNSKNVFTGGPDQAVTGAILRAPLGTALPATIADALNVAFVDSGYIADTGLKITPTRTIKSIKDWSMATIRDILEEFDGVAAWQHLETSGASFNNYVGDANVTTTAATVSTGTRTKVVMNASEIPHYAWAFKIKDGVRKVLIIIADAQVQKQDPLEFKKGAPVMWGVEVKSFPDGNGNYITIYTDDGVFTP